MADHQAPDTDAVALEAALEHGLMGAEPEEGETGKERHRNPHGRLPFHAARDASRTPVAVVDATSTGGGSWCWRQFLVVLRGLFGGFEGEAKEDLLRLGLPVLVLGGTAAFGYGFDVLAGPQATRHCAPSCST
ncbi:hypothetical protein [Streptomyces sp. RK9]|uniref:hypothetical protein n=1 Tax=Streptomyces sp. RK9 TaxID=3239284 RepID=UPI0038631D60